jgi:glycosyltransferase involved in cell wall biosynthesis
MPLGKQYRTFYLFPFYHTGGAEKVHLQITEATGGPDCIIFFTRRSANDQFLAAFRNTGCTIRDISRFTDNKWLYFLNLIYRGIITGYINRQQQEPVILNGQCNFAYKISPWVKKTIRQIELIHSFNSFSYIRVPFLPFITGTAMISKKRIADHISFYDKINVPAAFAEKIHYIPNAIKIPPVVVEKKEQPFTVLYVGRGGSEKRLHLVTAIAAALHQSDPHIHFEILGDVAEVVRQANFPHIIFHGNQSNEEMIASVYTRAHVLLLTSTTEGFPLVVMEAMAHGCAIIATPVGDIPVHVHAGENGFLFSSVNDEQLIIREGTEQVRLLQKNFAQWVTFSENNIRYAKHNFDIEKFNTAWTRLIKPDRLETT